MIPAIAKALKEKNGWNAPQAVLHKFTLCIPNS
jgi:hypothetical protein